MKKNIFLITVLGWIATILVIASIALAWHTNNNLVFQGPINYGMDEAYFRRTGKEMPNMCMEDLER